MAERNRTDLKNEFRDGERPTGMDFADLIDSFVNIHDDRVSVDPNDNLEIPAGVNLKESSKGIAGTLRFSNGQVQIHDGTGWKNIGGGGGAFTEVGGGSAVAYGGGNVGIGNFNNEAPAFRLEVELGENTGEDQRVLFGNAVLFRGEGALQTLAQFAHRDHANSSESALQQEQSGDVHINAPNDRQITISHNRTQHRLVVEPGGTIAIGGDLNVTGTAAKTDGGSWTNLSDARLKKDIRPFLDGLAKLMRVRPVRFRYDGRLDTNSEVEEIGVIGQEVEAEFPYMVTKMSPTRRTEDRQDIPDDLRMYNGSALTFVMVNAIKELAARVAELEQKLAGKLSEEVRQAAP